MATQAIILQVLVVTPQYLDTQVIVEGQDIADIQALDSQDILV